MKRKIKRRKRNQAHRVEITEANIEVISLCYTNRRSLQQIDLFPACTAAEPTQALIKWGPDHSTPIVAGVFTPCYNSVIRPHSGMVGANQIPGEGLGLLPIRSDKRGVLWVGSIPAAIPPSYFYMHKIMDCTCNEYK